MSLTPVVLILEDVQMHLDLLAKTQEVFRVVLCDSLQVANDPAAPIELRLPSEGVYQLMQPMFDLLSEAASNVRTAAEVLKVLHQMPVASPADPADGVGLALVANT